MKCHCGASCCYEWRDSTTQPCWGEVDVETVENGGEDEGDLYIHACRGHAPIINDGAYDGKYLLERESK